MQNILTEYIETSNLIIRNSILNDIQELQSVCFGWDEKKYLEGDLFDYNYIEKCLLSGDLPPQDNVNKEYYRIKTICSKKDLKIVGFFDLYHGYPKTTSIWISILLIKKEMQKNGFGKEVIEAIAKSGRDKKYVNIGVGVHLKNWKALRFWRKNGFDKILGIYGDYEFGENNFSIIRLEKSI